MTRTRRVLLLLAFALLGTSQPGRAHGPVCTSAAQCKARIAATFKVDVLPVALPEVPGGYTSGTGFSGEDLYVFRDGDYLYCEWADTSPPRIIDRGKWRISEGLVELTSIQDVAKDVSLDRTLLPFRLGSKPVGPSLLLGVEEALTKVDTIARERETPGRAAATFSELGPTSEARRSLWDGSPR